MATLPKEQVTQRAARTMVVIDASNATDATSDVVWDATTTLPYTVVLNTAAGDFDRDAVDAALEADPTWEPAP